MPARKHVLTATYDPTSEWLTDLFEEAYDYAVPAWWWLDADTADPVLWVGLIPAYVVADLRAEGMYAVPDDAEAIVYVMSVPESMTTGSDYVVTAYVYDNELEAVRHFTDIVMKHHPKVKTETAMTKTTGTLTTTGTTTGTKTTGTATTTGTTTGTTKTPTATGTTTTTGTKTTATTATNPRKAAALRSVREKIRRRLGRTRSRSR